MKKTLSIIALSIIGFGLVSCKKENKETQSPEAVATDSTALGTPVTADSAATSVTGEAPAAPVSNEPSTSIALSESNFDFGKIKKGDKVEHVYEVTNTGKNPLVISEVKPGCGCTAPDFTKEPIMPGKKGKITLHFDSSSFDGNVQKYADVFANVEKAPIKLTFTANIQP
ncbi:uncharacterized protein CHSO_4493 [Chryseobacterium sp. StRB126]|uniref:DUF1573 domain-containing protein n=1 Tax=Chryseobacterium sp. StRB126 TaxID=878220 RepID=UPI0004E98DEC|nr:DUF1573 domain-containing protein [Chryseobacterium sp. StRB126]BAP33530.1 uncharacterized protein CHSO_4493 [Chryseobacterium sp. StRB126]